MIYKDDKYNNKYDYKQEYKSWACCK